MTERKAVEVTIKVQVEGFGADITASCTIDQIPGLIRRLKAADILPANSPYLWDAQKPQDGPGQAQPTAMAHGTSLVCPIHQRPLKASKHKPGEYFCTMRLGDGVYCDHKIQL